MSFFTLIVVTAAGAASPVPDSVRVSHDGVWSSADDAVRTIKQDQALDAWVQPEEFAAYRFDDAALTETLNAAPLEFTRAADVPAEIALPMPDGGFARFRFVESPVMAPELAVQFPEIKTYLGQGIDDSRATVRFDRTPAGVHAQIHSAMGTILIDPYLQHDANLHVSYYKRDYAASEESLRCLTEAEPDPDHVRAFEGDDLFTVVGENLRRYDLACAATGEYTAQHGGTVAGGMAAVVTAINRVSGIYELDLSIRLQLVAESSAIIYTDAAADPYTNGDAVAMSSENQSNLDTVIGNASYDIGHVLGTGGGGIATPSSVCTVGQKAQGASGLLPPAGDPFSIDFIAHEMGHQFGASHTFNGANGACGSAGQHAPATAYEPGSGSTIMSYAGICNGGMGSDDLQTQSDPYFHSASRTQIINFANAAGCAGLSPTGNSPPVVNAGPNYTIPQGTPFRLIAAGSDPDGDRLTYCWEQRDLGPQAPLSAADQGTIPLFRSWSPILDGTRTLPRLAELTNGTAPIGERLPTTPRTMNFRCTVRDQRGGASFDDMSATVTSAGPFAVTAPNTAVTWSTSPQTVSWSVANTHIAPVSTPNVNILLSLDGGLNFPITLAANTPNDGTQSLTVPALFSNTARIKVEGAGNIFFDISNANFTISMPVQFALPGFTFIDDSVPNGNNNGSLDPGESGAGLSIRVQNTGPSTATGVSATLTSLTSTVAVLSGSSGYANLAGFGGSGFNTTPFVLDVDPSHVCGSPVNLRLAIVSAQGARTADVALRTGEGSPVTFSYDAITGADPVVAIPDAGDPANIPLTVSGVGAIADLDFSIDGTVCTNSAGATTVGLDHTWVGELNITLISPAGTAVPLTMRPGGGGTGSSGNNLCQARFDDDGAFASIQTIVSAAAPYTGTWKSAWPLSYFDGQNADGVWTLRITDTGPGDTGHLRAFSLIVTPRVCEEPYVPGDVDGDGDADATDHEAFVDCMRGPVLTTPPPGCPAVNFARADFLEDGDVDLEDWSVLQQFLP